MAKTDQLGRIVSDNRRGRAMDEARGKALRERLKTINEAKSQQVNGFWCTECCRDFEAIGLKQTRKMDTEDPIAFYGAACPKGHVAIRRITDKFNDPYYWQSEHMRREQIDHADDFLTPADPRFQYVYPDQWRRLQEENEKRIAAGVALTT